MSEKKGFFEQIATAVTDVVVGGAATVDTVVSTAASAVGKLLPASERAVVEEGLSDVVEGFKADDATSASVVAATPAPVAAPAPANSPAAS